MSGIAKVLYCKRCKGYLSQGRGYGLDKAYCKHCFTVLYWFNKSLLDQ